MLETHSYVHASTYCRQSHHWALRLLPPFGLVGLADWSAASKVCKGLAWILKGMQKFGKGETCPRAPKRCRASSRIIASNARHYANARLLLHVMVTASLPNQIMCIPCKQVTC